VREIRERHTGAASAARSGLARVASEAIENGALRAPQDKRAAPVEIELKAELLVSMA